MRDSFRDGGPALVPKTDPLSCPKDLMRKMSLLLPMDFNMASTPALHQCGPMDLCHGGEGLGTLILQQPLPPWSLPSRESSTLLMGVYLAIHRE